MVEDLSPAIENAYYLVTGKWLATTVEAHYEYIPQHIPNPEKLLIKKQLLESISEEAKEVMWILFHLPSEIFDLFFYKDKFSRARLFKFLKADGWRTIDILRTFKELRQVDNKLRRI